MRGNFCCGASYDVCVVLMPCSDNHDITSFLEFVYVRKAREARLPLLRILEKYGFVNTLCKFFCYIGNYLIVRLVNIDDRKIAGVNLCHRLCNHAL